MRPTLDVLYKKFDDFNKLCFEGKLPAVEIKLSRARKSLGQLRFKTTRTLLGRKRISDISIAISTSFDMSETIMEDILIHEMIHLYILVNKIKDTSPHGPAFRSIMNEINFRYGRHVVVSHRGDGDAVVDERSRRNYFCLVTLANGKWGIMVVAESYIFRLWRDMEREPSVKECKWYFSDHPLLSRYRRSRTMKVYRISLEDLIEVLNTAAPLVNENGVISAAKIE